MKSEVESFKDLVVWQKAMQLVIAVYGISEQLPRSELYGLVSQTRRSAVSIPSNIAEGCRRHNTKEYVQFCGIAAGSSAELETQLLIIKQIYSKLEVEDALGLVDEVQRMLRALCKQLKLLTTH